MRKRTIQIAVRLDTDVVHELDQAVAHGDYASRADAIRAAPAAWRRQRYDDEIAQRYRRAYADRPPGDEDRALGEAAAALLSQVITRQEGLA